MTRRKHTPESARARVGQLLTAFGWDKERRKAWLDEHVQLSPKELTRAAELALGVDRKIWQRLPKAGSKQKQSGKKGTEDAVSDS